MIQSTLMGVSPRYADRVLITGGAGFIGSHLACALVARGYRVRVLDNLTPQVGGAARQRPDVLAPEVELVRGDVRDADSVGAALQGCQAVVHLAARVGVGQSMYEVAQYASVNSHGTAVLLQAIMDRPVRKLIVASCMSIYGEGLYRGPDGRMLQSVQRTRSRLELRDWEPRLFGKQVLTPLPTPEWKRPSLASIYALNKYEQERMCLLCGAAYGIPTVALRLFNVFGPDQALSNSYTGVLANFAERLLNGQAPMIFEDGHQRRDFVSVHDVVRAFTLALERPGADGQALNIGSGASASVLEVARALARALQREEIEPQLTSRYRVGDIRHCFADITQARHTLGYEPDVSLDRGLTELAQWLSGQVAQHRAELATAQLPARAY